MIRRIALPTMVLALASASASAHVVRGILYPTLATAFVSSPSAAEDALLPIAWAGHDTGLRVACFYVANTSPALAAAAGFPRITAVGFELPGPRAGFALSTPIDSGWQVVNNVSASLLGRGQVTLDFALLSSGPGIAPGQTGSRGNGTKFCVTGPFPEGSTIEQILNGIVIGYQAQANGPIAEIGLWDNAQRAVPLFQ